MIKKQTKLILRLVFIIDSICSLFFVPWILVKAWILPLPNTIQEQLDEAIGHGFDGIIVYADVKGKAPAFYSAGWHDKKNNVPSYPKALFKIASISKLYIAVAITKLVNNGQLSLDNKLSDYFPELIGRIENAEKITLKMMLQHRSGIPNYTDIENYWAAPKESNKENLKLVLDLPAKFEPGEEYEYSNTNYLLLADLIEKVVAYPYFQYIKKEILTPLNLKNTFPSINEVNINDVMSGYHIGHPLDLRTDNQGMLATAEDVGIFLRALNDGSLFDKNEMDTYNSVYVFEHTGLIPGYQSIAKYHKDIDAVVIQFSGPTFFEGYNWNLSEIIYRRVVRILKDSSK